MLLGLILIICAVITVVFSDEKKETPEDPNAPAIKVNGRVIPKNYIEMEAQLMVFRMEQSGQKVQPQLLGMFRKNAAESLIKIELILEAAEKANMTVTQDIVDLAYNEMVKNIGSKEKYEELCQKLSVTPKFLKKQVRDNLLVDMYIKKVTADLPVFTDADAEKYYNENQSAFKVSEQVRARHILFTVSKDASPEEQETARKKAEDALNRLKGGEDFATLAKELSQCPSASEGGNLGFFSKGQMVPEFEEAAFSLKVGELSKIVKTKFGYHIILVIEKKEPSTMSFDDVKERIKQRFNQKRIRDKLLDLIDEKMKSADIEYLDASLKPIEPIMVTPGQPKDPAKEKDKK